MKNLLIVVDCQKDFLLPDGKLNLGHDTKKLIKDISDFVKGFEGDVIYTLDSHKKDSCEFKLFPEHCVRDTVGMELVEELKESKPNNFYVIEKSSFTDEYIVFLINKLSYREDYSEIHVVGICTHICVHDIISDIVNHYKNEHNITPKVIVHKNLVDDFNPEMAEFALKRLQNLYGVTVKEV